MALFNGILCPIVTPFCPDLQEVDFATLDRVLDRLIAANVHGIVVGGTTGEYYAQDAQERTKVLKHVAVRAKGKAQLIAGINSARPDETNYLGVYAKDLGYDAILLAAPYYSLPLPDELATHAKHVAKRVGLPMMLYNFPARTGVDIDIAVLEALQNTGEVVGIKESSGSLARMFEHVVHFGNRYERVCGADDQAIDYFLWDSKAWVAGFSNVLPAEHVSLYEVCVLRRDFDAGRRIADRLLPLFLFLEHSGRYNQYVKFGLELVGLSGGDVRPPLLPLTEVERARFRTLFAAARGIALAG